MTKREWEGSDDPQVMLYWASKRMGTRKCRLFAAACSRRVLPLAVGAVAGLAEAIEQAEAFADGPDDRHTPLAVAGAIASASAAFAAAAVAAAAKRDSDAVAYAAHACHTAAALAGTGYAEQHAVVWSVAADAAAAEDAFSDAEERRIQATLLRDITGPIWRRKSQPHPDCPRSVRELAAEIEATRAFDRLPELADALLATNGAPADIVRHCRSPGPHVRGCRPLALILGMA